MEDNKWSDLFRYDESSPTCLRWAVDVFSGRHYKIKERSVGDVAGSVKCDSKHSSVKIGGESFLVHRVIWELFNGSVPAGFIVDHEDRNPTNNRLRNLRLVTKAINSRNQHMRVDNTSGVVGVSLGAKGTVWRASWCTLNGKSTQRSFSVRKYGAAARELAIKVRENAIQELNMNGAGYTEGHGT